MSTFNDSMNFLADHMSKKIRTQTTTVNVGSLSGNSYVWVTAPRPSGTYDHAWITGWYVTGSGNTSVLIYNWASSSGKIALRNLSSSTISPSINVYWTVFG